MKVHHSYSQSPQQVWSVLSDFGAMARWFPELAASAQIARRGIQVGSVRELSFREPQGGVTGVRERIVACGDGWFTYVLDGGFGVYTDAGSTWRVEPEGNGARVTVQSHVRGGPWWTLFLTPLVHRALRQGLRRALRGLQSDLDKQS